MRINQLPSATEVAQNDVLAIDTSNGTYQVPRSVLAPSPYISTIPAGQWSGSGSDYYITVTASNVTADSILYPFFDSASEALLTGPVWAVPASGSFTIHTSAIPSGTVTISVLLAGVVGEAQYQVLADVYSKSQVDSIVAQSTAKVTQFAFTSEYSSLLNAINSVRATKVYPISFTKFSNAALSDLPASLTNTNEINGIIFGTERRSTVLIHTFTGNASVLSVWIRTMFDGNWHSDWAQI